MIATKILIKNQNTEISSFDDFDLYALKIVGNERNSFLQDLRFSIEQGWIKNMHNQFWDADNKLVVYEYYSDDVHQTRFFQNYMAAKNYFSDGVNKLNSEGWTVRIETVPERTIIPFVDAERIFDEDITVLA